jgi:hypothetical protein
MDNEHNATCGPVTNFVSAVDNSMRGSFRQTRTSNSLPSVEEYSDGNIYSGLTAAVTVSDAFVRARRCKEVSKAD